MISIGTPTPAASLAPVLVDCSLGISNSILFLRCNLGEVGESFAALELGVLNDTYSNERQHRLKILPILRVTLHVTYLHQHHWRSFRSTRRMCCFLDHR